jgi:hypothetical protein
MLHLTTGISQENFICTDASRLSFSTQNTCPFSVYLGSAHVAGRESLPQNWSLLRFALVEGKCLIIVKQDFFSLIPETTSNLTILRSFSLLLNYLG